MRTSLIRLPDWAIKEIENIAQEKCLRFATVVRCIVIDHLNENAPGKHHGKTGGQEKTTIGDGIRG